MMKMIFHFHEQVNYKREIAKRLKEKGISDEIIKEWPDLMNTFHNIADVSKLRYYCHSLTI